MDHSTIVYAQNRAYDIHIPEGANYYSNSERHLAITRSDQTGDVPHVAAALLHDPLLDVLILIPDGKEADSIIATYRNAIKSENIAPQALSFASLLDPRKRIKTLSLLAQDNPLYFNVYAGLVPNGGSMGRMTWLSSKDQNEIKNFNALAQCWTYESGNKQTVEYITVTVGACTSLVALAYLRNPEAFFKLNKAELTSPKVQAPAIEKWFKAVIKLPLDLQSGAKRENVCLIWSRYSGGIKNGYNPAGDSDIAGQKQLIDLARSLKFLVVTVGHDKDATTATPRGDIHLGEFWSVPGKDPTFSNPFLGKGREGQTSFYSLLLDRHNVIQLGQKTGGMDNAVLVRVPAVYIEDQASPQISRMEKWSKDGGMSHYKAAIISKPPTSLGKALRYIEDTDKRTKAPGNVMANARVRAEKEVIDKPGNYPAGYSKEDIQVIKGAIIALASDMKYPIGPLNK